MCNRTFESLELKKEDQPTACPTCGNKEIEREVTAHGGYIGDMGEGSTKRKSSGSFKR